MKYIEQAFAENHVFPLGPNVTGFENDLKKYAGIAGATALSSGTAAIHLALILLGVEPNDEVICSSFTFAASANPIRYLFSTPVLVDSEKDTWNMDPDLLLEAIEDRINKTGKKPKALILVHLYGMPSKIDEIRTIAERYEIPIVEDAAEALGSMYKDRYCGTFGEMGIYSFNGNKIITTSGGGALISDKKDYCDKALFLATQARDPASHYQHSEIGYNYRMSNISAGIGRGQMEVLNERIKKRRENFFFYKDAFSEIGEIKFLSEPSSEYYSNHWLSVFEIDKESKVDREGLRIFLAQNNIESRPLWKPLHLQPVFAQYPSYVNGISEDLFSRGLCLPSSSNLSDADRNFVAKSIREYFHMHM